MKNIRLIMIVFLLLPALVSGRTFARWHTSMGSFTAQLYNELVPITANNFKSLAENGFYNNLIFHRVIAGFVIQDGCPNGNGTGGPGYTIQDEIHPDLNHNRAGMLAMAKTSQPNSAGSQYYFTLARQPNLNGTYSVFGQIIEELDVVLAIGNVPTDANDRPIEPVNIHQVRMLDLQIGELMPDNSQTLYLDANQSEYFMVEAYTNQADLNFNWYVNEVLQPENSFLFEHSFAEAGSHSLRCTVASSDSISFDAEWEIMVASSSEDTLAPAISALQAGPNPFYDSVNITFELGKSAALKLEIYNLKGQKLRDIGKTNFSAGGHSLGWDGRDHRGQKCPPGFYFVQLRGSETANVKKILKL